MGGTMRGPQTPRAQAAFPPRSRIFSIPASTTSATNPSTSPTTPPPTPPPPPPPRRSPLIQRTLTAGKWCGILLGSTVLGVIVVGGVIFVHDAFTYNEKYLANIPVTPLLTDGKTGGPKNLPLASHFFAEDEDEEVKRLAEKPRLVVVGAGWGVSVIFCFDD